MRGPRSSYQEIKGGIRMPELKVGRVLRNGSIVLDYHFEEDDGYVLCLLPNNSLTPYATWAISRDLDTFWGNYFQELEEALDNFKKRVKGLTTGQWSVPY